MNLARFIPAEEKSCSPALWGIVDGGVVQAINGSPFGDWENKNKKYKISDVKFLSPCSATKIVCAGLNYRGHARELGAEINKEPVIFIKPSSSILNPGENIIKPDSCSRLDYEAELAVVIGKKIKNCPVDKIREYILGYTCFNDVTARDIQIKDGQWTRSKSYDTFSPIGPVVSTEADPGQLDIKLYLNGNLKQSSNTSDMVFSPEKIVSYISTIMTLYPGDVVSTGTPEGIGEMKPGDVVEVEIEKIGTLKNFISLEGDINV